MYRLIYEKSLSYRGFLLIPFLFTRVSGESIYSYSILSDRAHKSKFHQVENPAGLYSSKVSGILNIAKQHLRDNVSQVREEDYFQERYTYDNNLIILHQEMGRCFYDHYPPRELRNIAAPKLFNDAADCLNWVKQGLDRNRSGVR